MDEFTLFWLKRLNSQILSRKQEIKDIFEEEFKYIQLGEKNGKYLFLIGKESVVDISISSSKICIALEDYSQIQINPLLTKCFSDSSVEQPEIYSFLNTFNNAGKEMLKIAIGDNVIAINRK